MTIIETQYVVIFSLIVGLFAVIVVKANVEYRRAKKNGEIDKEQEDADMQIW